jgi:hypothetical protein
MALPTDPEEVIAAIEAEGDRICSLPMPKITPTPRDPKEEVFTWPTSPRADVNRGEVFMTWTKDFITKYDINERTQQRSAD